MSANSGIEWCDATLNPIAGCTRVSEGCRHCYAEVMAHRLANIPATREKYAGLTDKHGRWTGEVRFVESVLELPYRWRKPKRIFVNSMSDLFHPNVVSENWIERILQVVADCPQHTFMALTKRPRLMSVFMQWFYGAHGPMSGSHPLENLWLGTSAEDQPTADERLPYLEETPAAVRFVSLEPLLGAVEILPWLIGGKLHWIIAGGESGPHARLMEPDWVRDIRDDCVAAGVPFFFKQWGGKREGAVLDGREWREFPA